MSRELPGQRMNPAAPSVRVLAGPGPRQPAIAVYADLRQTGRTGMNTSPADDNWIAGEAYEAFMGRWSRRMATGFLGWLGVIRLTARAWAVRGTES